MTPYEHFKTWFSDLPLKYQQDLVDEISSYFPVINVNPMHRDFVKHFFAGIDAVSAKGKQAEIGTILSLRAVVSHVIAVHLAINESAAWQQEKKELEEMAQLTGSCSLAEHAAAQNIHISEWNSLSTSWYELLEEGLSDKFFRSSYPLSF